MDKLGAMETFVAVVDQGSLTGAAAQLRKAVPTVVRSLALLEEELGVRLLQRTTRRQALTHEGRAYLARCRSILTQVREAELEAIDHHAEPHGKIRVTAPVLFGSKKLAPLLHRFLEKHPQVQVELILLDRVVNLVDEGFDLGLRIAPLPDSSLVAVKLGEVTRQLVAAPEFLKGEKLLSRPEQLSDRHVVVATGGAQGGKWPFSRKGQRFSVGIHGSLECNSAQVSIDACRAGLGYGYFLSYQIEELLSSGQLVELLPEYQLPPIPIQAIFPEAQLLSARTRALIDWLKRYASARG